MMDNSMSSWWLWLLLGFVLLALELMTPGGFYVFFFGLGAISVGLLTALGLAGAPWLQWLLFALISTGAVLLFRKRLQGRLQVPPGREVDSIVGETAVAKADIGAHEIGMAELRGTAWSARNVSESPIVAGQRCRVERVEGLMLHIRG
jgi:membrane protein implicated in regulation of membrane protease activity